MLAIIGLVLSLSIWFYVRRDGLFGKEYLVVSCIVVVVLFMLQASVYMQLPDDMEKYKKSVEYYYNIDKTNSPVEFKVVALDKVLKFKKNIVIFSFISLNFTNISYLLDTSIKHECDLLIHDEFYDLM
jgi:hypothetical protein